MLFTINMNVLILIPAFIIAIEGTNLRKIGSFKVNHPAFTTLYTDNNGQNATERYNLLISTFAAPSLFGGATDTVQLVRNVGTRLGNVGDVKPEMLTSNVKWPNEVAAVPDAIFPNKEIIAIPDGFLVPFKTGGSIKFMDITGGQKQGPYTITGSSDGSWFYHRVQWYDMDGDGDQDIVTCRAREPIVPVIFGREDEELLWLENPSGDYKSSWTAHVLAHGPDSFFRFVELPTPEGVKHVVLAAQFFTKSLTVYWTTQANGLFTDASKISKRVIDDTIGNVFEVDLVDLNKDGRLDLLVTTNGMNGTLLAYEVPNDFRTGTFKKHTIAVGFIPRKSGTGKGSPGSAFTVQPATNDTSKRPLIMMSGDDDGRAYYFEAHSEDPADWTYTKTTFCDAGDGTVGQVSAADVDGDGYVDVFVPSYSTNELLAYTFAPGQDANPNMLVG